MLSYMIVILDSENYNNSPTDGSIEATTKRLDRLTTTTNSIVGSSSNSGGDSISSSSGSSGVFKEPFRNQFPDGFLITTGKR